MKSLPRLSYPGEGYYYVICDVCGKKIRRKDSVRIDDKWNTQNGLVVCKDDADRRNEQNKPIAIAEKQIPDPINIRPPQKDVNLINPNSDAAPSAPQNLIATAAGISTEVIQLSWQGPISCGSDEIIGYAIYQQNPVYSGLVLLATTSSPDTYFIDSVSDPTQQYGYTVAAINSYGQGPQSALAYYPNGALGINTGVDYLTVSQTNFVLSTGSGLSIVLTH